LGDAKLWDSAQKQLKNAVVANKLDYFEETGEAAFYGPKIDFMATDALGREHQVATVQLDFVMPQRFKLDYTDEQGERQTPIMIHSALLGSIERFLGVYIEHTAGRFPVWLAPEQIRVATLNQDEPVVKFAQELVDQAQEQGLRATLDNASESVGKKIRSAELMRVPYTVVVGDKELASGQLSPRLRQDLAVESPKQPVTVEEFLKTVAHEAKGRVNKSSL
jgi:threonyl-tRNA synthetase